MYLERVPNSPDAPTHRNGIESLKRQIAAAAAAHGDRPGTGADEHRSAAERDARAHGRAVAGRGSRRCGASSRASILLAVAPKCRRTATRRRQTCTAKPGEDPASLAKDTKDAGTAVGLKTGGLMALIAGSAPSSVAGSSGTSSSRPGPVEKTGKIKPRLTPAVAPGYAGMSLGGTF